MKKLFNGLTVSIALCFVTLSSPTVSAGKIVPFELINSTKSYLILENKKDDDCDTNADGKVDVFDLIRQKNINVNNPNGFATSDEVEEIKDELSQEIAQEQKFVNSLLKYAEEQKTDYDSRLKELENIQNGYETFLTVGCIGDSLASGECYSNETETPVGHDLYKYSWGQYMARMSGNTYYNFSCGGLSTRTWLTSSYRKQIVDGNHDCMAYIIGLGANDALADSRHVEVGSASDIDLTNYNNNADSYYGNYGRIIQILHEYNPKTKIFLLTMPTAGESYQPYNEAIRKLADMFNNCYCIDLHKNAFDLYNSPDSIIRSCLRNGHYNAYAYSIMAKIIGNEISKFMANNKSEFLDIEFIDSEYAWYQNN